MPWGQMSLWTDSSPPSAVKSKGNQAADPEVSALGCLCSAETKQGAVVGRGEEQHLPLPELVLGLLRAEPVASVAQISWL